ncbi:hypothetical protein DL98DRAFT_627361 [Cadophora sp. DSE1049]|nr:hypothetical protein DL98DRAFT_627361 [Cadophora sp. DSE1049]
MSSALKSVLSGWTSFSATEKRNIGLYILGIMFYKFGLEAFNGSIIALATNRYDYDADLAGTVPRTFERVGLMTGLNQAFQCIGSITIAPLIKAFPTKNVLSTGVFIFGLFSAILLIVDTGTGGSIVPSGWHKTHGKDDFSYYGNYNTDGLIPIYCITGIGYGMVELIRRVIPRDIVGGHVQKLRRMDALVHMFYEVAGTAGSFCTALALIPRLGNNYSFLITPICFTCSSAIWFFITDLDFVREKPSVLEGRPSYIQAVIGAFWLFGESVWTGARLIFSSRRYIWLIPGYSFALYGHRYLENGISPAIARRYLGNSAWSQIMVGGSNFGELLGAGFAFLFADLIHTPIPWLRLDALLLLILWYLPFWYPASGQVKYAWMAAGTFIPVSFGWAAGDVSLAAYIQASLARVEAKTRNVSALGAVMAFLYSTYIVSYAITSPLLGRYMDKVYAQTGGARGGGNIHDAMYNIAGVQFTVICACMISSSFVPKGSLALNPAMLFDENLDQDLGIGLQEDARDVSKDSHDGGIQEEPKSGNDHPTTVVTEAGKP